MKISAVHRVPPLLSLCTFVIEVFLSVLRGPFGTSIFMEESVDSGVYATLQDKCMCSVLC